MGIRILTALELLMAATMEESLLPKGICCNNPYGPYYYICIFTIEYNRVFPGCPMSAPAFSMVDVAMLLVPMAVISCSGSSFSIVPQFPAHLAALAVYDQKLHDHSSYAYSFLSINSTNLSGIILFS